MGVRCDDRRGVDPQVTSGLAWVRRRQRSLARGVLALFCAAWLQAAVVPCVMAHDGDVPVQAATTDDHHQHQAHDGGAHDAGAAGHPCLYCPPDADHGKAGGCDGLDCAYPHDPQVDARAVGVIFTALPVAFVLPAQAVSSATDCGVVAVPGAIPRVSLSVSYCRFIE
jgi:hypothetical protein